MFGRKHSHISVVDERPSARSLQRIVKEILQLPVAGVLLGRSGSPGGDAGPRSAEDAAPLGALRARNEQRPIPAGVGSPRVQAHEPHFVLLLLGLSWVHPPVQRLLHHPKVGGTLRGSCACPCCGDASPGLRGACTRCWGVQSAPVALRKPNAITLDAGG